MSWNHLSLVSLVLGVFWLFALFFDWKKHEKIATSFYIIALAIFTFFLISFWITLDRPPLRTLGETRLWYAFFLSFAGLLIRVRLSIKWLNIYAVLMAFLFLVINLMHPEAHDKTLMPALQSPWFVPHVIVYLLGYAVLGASFLVGVKGILTYSKEKSIEALSCERFLGVRLATLGLLFISLGLIFGALWAKEAWGHYWTWDPKETWALLTWLIYLLLIHLEFKGKIRHKRTFWLLVLAFIILLGCWFGVNYMPSASSSVHTYSS